MGIIVWESLIGPDSSSARMWNKAHQGFSPQSAFDELKMSPGVTRMEPPRLVLCRRIALPVPPESLHRHFCELAESPRRLSVLLRNGINLRYPGSGQILLISSSRAAQVRWETKFAFSVDARAFPSTIQFHDVFAHDYGIEGRFNVCRQVNCCRINIPPLNTFKHWKEIDTNNIETTNGSNFSNFIYPCNYLETSISVYYIL